MQLCFLILVIIAVFAGVGKADDDDDWTKWIQKLFLTVKEHAMDLSTYLKGVGKIVTDSIEKVINSK